MGEESRRPYTYALVFTALFHLAHVLSLPLAVSYDGFWYVRLAEVLGHAEFPEKWDFLRTPLYPLSLKVAFWVLGRHALAAVAVSSLFGLLGIWALGAAVCRITSPKAAAAVVVLLTLYPDLVAYEHCLLSEAGTFFFLGLLLLALLWETPRPAVKTALITGVVLTGYYYRPTILYLAPVAAVIHGLHVACQPGQLSWSAFFTAGRRRWALAAVHAAAIVVLPYLGSAPWRAQLDQTNRKGDAIFLGLVHQIVVPPEDPVWEGMREQYVKAIHESMERGRLSFSGVSGGVAYGLAAHLQARAQPPGGAYYLAQVRTNTLRWAKGVVRAQLHLMGLPGLTDENNVFRTLILSNTESGSKLSDGPPEFGARLKPDFAQKTGRPVLAPSLKGLVPVYELLVFLGWLVTVAGFVVALCRLDARLLALTAVPLAFCTMHALLMITINRLAMPAYPLVLANLVVVPILVLADRAGFRVTVWPQPDPDAGGR